MDSFLPSLELAKNITQKYGTPVFATSANILENRAQQMLSAFPWKRKKILYAIKANPNPTIVKTLKESGIHGIDTVSPHEVQLALELGFKPENIVFTGSNPSDDDIRFVTEKDVLINAGSLSEISRFGKMFPGKEIAVRLNPNIGAGEHKKIITGLHDSKFGVLPEDFELVKKLLQKYNLHLTGVHSHIGSGFYDANTFIESAKLVLKTAEEFSNLDFVDFGGGFGIHYHPQKEPIDLLEFGQKTQKLLENFSEKNGREIEMRLEPGKFLVGESTCLLTKVTTVKQNGPRLFAGTNTGFNHLVRSIMYDGYHHIVNLSNSNEKEVNAEIVGNICETGDIFGHDRKIKKPREGDILAIMTTGAYGSSMSSNYNLRPFAAEVMVNNSDVQLTRKRQTYKQMMENFIF